MATVYDKMDLTWEKALKEKTDLEYAEKHLYSIGWQQSCVIAEKNGVPVLIAFNYLVPKCLVGIKCGKAGLCGKDNGIDYCDRYSHDVDYGGTHETNLEKEALVVRRLDSAARKNLSKEGFSSLEKIPKDSVCVFRLPYRSVESGNEKMLKNSIKKIMNDGFEKEFDRLLWIPCSSNAL